MKILNIHEQTEIKGGAEVYISQLDELLIHYGHEGYWLGINNFSGDFGVFNDGQMQIARGKKIQDIFSFISRYLRDNEIDVINIHNIFEKDLLEYLFNTALPIVKFVHSPVMVCPGKDKFWRYSERPCTIKYGIHCFWHIYSQGCASRNPVSVLKAWDIVNYEVEEASPIYRKIIVMSDYIRGELIECGIPVDKIICNPYFTPVVEQGPDLFNIRPRRLLFVGRLVSSKGPHVMIKSLAKLLKTETDLYLDIVGEGNMKQELVDLVLKEGLEEKVIFHPWAGRDQINRLMLASFIVLFPSIYPEAFGIVGIEAMMRSRPVIAFNVGGVNTWLKNGETGFLIERNDSNGMADKVNILLNDATLYSMMCVNARKAALEHFTPDIHIEKLLKVYNNLSK